MPFFNPKLSKGQLMIQKKNEKKDLLQKTSPTSHPQH